MAKAKKEKIEDLTEIGEDIGELKEIEVTEIENIIDENETEPELIEEKACDQEEKEEEDSKSKSKKLELSQEQTEKKQEQPLSVDSSEPEVKLQEEKPSQNSKGSGVKTVKPQAPKNNPSQVKDKTSKEVKTQTKNKSETIPGKPQGVRSVKPSKSSKDGLTRSTFGLFSR